MRSVEFDTQPAMLSDFNADKVRREFGLAAGTTEESAVLYVYRHESFPVFFTDKNRAVLSRGANDHSIRKIRHRYGFFKQFAPSLSLVDEARRDGLLIALICDDYLIDANTSRRDFDDNLLIIASDIWDEALEIQKGFIPAAIASPEGLALAHLNTLSDLDVFYHLIEQQDYQELTAMKDEYFPDTRDFIQPQTPIGEAVMEYIADIEHEIRVRRPSAEIIQLFGKAPAP